MRWQVQQSVLLRGGLALQYFCVLWRFHAAKMVYQVLKLVAQSICHVAATLLYTSKWLLPINYFKRKLIAYFQ
jgi:hypothetical protein